MAPDPSTHSVRRAGLYSLAAQLATAMFTAALTLYLARVLGPAGYGVFALALALGAVVLLPADFGIAASTARFTAERRADHGAIAEIVREGLRLKLLVTTLACGALAALAGPLAEMYEEPGLRWPLVYMALAVIGQSFVIFFTAVLVALRRTDLQFVLYGLEGAIEFTVSVILVVVVGGAASASLGRAIGYAVGALLGFFLLTRVLRVRLRPRFGRGRPKAAERLGRYAGALLVIDAAFTLLLQAGVLLIGAILTATAAGLFQAPLRLVTFMQMAGLAAASAVAPRLARRDDAPPSVDALQAGVRWLTILHGALLAIAVAWPERLVSIALGDDYAESATVLRALAPVVFLSGLAPLVSISVNYLGAARLRLPIVLGTVLLNAAIGLILIHHIGVVGGAIALSISYLVYCPAHLWLCRRLVGLRLRSYFVTTLRVLVASAAMMGTLTLIGGNAATFTAGTVGLLGGVGVYVAVLALTRELRPR